MTLRIEWTGLIVRYWFGFGERLAVIYPLCSYNAVIDMTGSLRLFVGITRLLVLPGVNPGSLQALCNITSPQLRLQDRTEVAVVL